MFSTCSEPTPRAPIPDGSMERIMQPCTQCASIWLYLCTPASKLSWSLAARVSGRVSGVPVSPPWRATKLSPLLEGLHDDDDDEDGGPANLAFHHHYHDCFHPLSRDFLFWHLLRPVAHLKIRHFSASWSLPCLKSSITAAMGTQQWIKDSLMIKLKFVQIGSNIAHGAQDECNLVR